LRAFVQCEEMGRKNGSGEQKRINLGNEAFIYLQPVPRRVEQSNDVCHELAFTMRGRLRVCN
jgi:hypothetical protein